MEKKSIKKNLTPIEDLIAEDSCGIGSYHRNQFKMECDAFIIEGQLKEERLCASLTQEQLVARIEFLPCGKGQADIQKSTLVK